MASEISQWIVSVPVILFAITIHEYAHGRAALRQGDPTAKNMGRLTLNPLPHIDPLGALCLFLFHFGWAKPVPVNHAYFRNLRQDIIIVSLAGPLANLLAAFVAGVFIRIFLIPSDIYCMVLFYMLFMNIGLFLFNLLPLPPLDGSHVLENVLSPGVAQKYREIGRHGPFILLGIIFLDRFANTGIISTLLVGPMHWLAHLFAGDNLNRLLYLLR